MNSGFSIDCDTKIAILPCPTLHAYRAALFFSWPFLIISLIIINDFICVGPPPQPIVVISNHLVQLQSSNQHLSMKCIPDGKGVSYTWEKRYSTLPSRAQRVNTSNMIIVNLTPEDSGQYRCIISNSTGRIFSDYKSVTVKGKLHTVSLI